MKYTYLFFALSILFFVSCKTTKLANLEKEVPENYTRRVYGMWQPETDKINELNLEKKEYDVELFRNGVLTKRYTERSDHRGERVKIDTFIYDSKDNIISYHTITKDKKGNTIYRDSSINVYRNTDLISTVFTSLNVIYKGEYTYKNDTIFEDGYIDGEYIGRTFKIFDKTNNVFIKKTKGSTCNTILKTYLNKSGNTTKITWQDEEGGEINTFTNFHYDSFGRLLSEKGYKDGSTRSITVYKYDQDPLEITSQSMKAVMSKSL